MLPQKIILPRENKLFNFLKISVDSKTCDSIILNYRNKKASILQNEFVLKNSKTLNRKKERWRYIRREMSVQLSTGGRSRTLDNTTNGVRRLEESLENRFQSGWYPTSDVPSRAILLSEDRSTEKGITIRRSVGQLIIGYLSRRPVTEIFSRRASVSLSKTRRDRSRSTCEMGEPSEEEEEGRGDLAREKWTSH